MYGQRIDIVNAFATLNTMTTLQVRIDEPTKNKAKKIFKQMGMDMSSGIKLFLNQVINTRTLPFQPRTPNGFTEKQEAEMIKELEYARKHGKIYDSAKALFEDLDKE
ncbi:MAG: type II toxin-antitoxin system RelB/DinJ family antitoxin [Parcubacteria group bacterium]